MKNFDWSSFTRKIAVKSDIKTMYDAWTKAAEIEKWFLSECHFLDMDKIQIDKNTNAVKGNSYAWNWYLFEPTEFGRVTEANGKDFFQFTFAGECLVDIKLSSQGEYTLVELTQKNIPSDDESKQGIRLGCDTGWSFYMVNLKSVYEGGLDLRNKGKAHMGMINM